MRLTIEVRGVNNDYRNQVVGEISLSVPDDNALSFVLPQEIGVVVVGIAQTIIAEYRKRLMDNV